MRAITVSEFGSPEVLVPTELPSPEPANGAVLVEVTGAGVGPWDAKMRSGAFGPQTFPYIPGAEVSGIVSAVGPGVTGFAVGDAVFGSPGSTGGYTEYAVVDQTRLSAAPPGLELEAAGGVPIGAITALEGLDDHLGLQSGQSVLVAGASGGVGLFVVQMAKARGARVVATAGSANHDFLREHGADEALDYHGDWVDAARGADAAFDCVGGPTWDGCLRAVRPGGRAVSINASADTRPPEGVEASRFSATVTAARLAQAAALIASGQVRVEIEAHLPLDEAARAHEMIETGHTRGKILLIPG